MKSDLRFSKASKSTLRLVEKIVGNGWRPGYPPAWFNGRRQKGGAK